jgi:hypothetical protein|tara:strand:- start:947 stop:1378 length:432 start_codon:yes stop_codon:yes gene_type:complete
MQVKFLSIITILLFKISYAQEITISTEVTAPFFSVLKDLRKYNICLEETLGSEAIIVVRDDNLSYRHVAIADGSFLDNIIIIRYNQHLINMPFKEQKFVLLHEILHHAQYFHWDSVLGMRTYSREIPDYYEIALAQASILLSK